jgi:hypothetical protein
MPNYLDEAHRAEIVKLSATFTSQTEWPTWLLLVGFYLAWAVIVFYGQAFGEVFTIVLFIPLVVLWLSIQHVLINESSGLLSWLFLNLNFHLVHHDLPGLPWFYLPRVYRARREQWIARNNGYVIHGYFQLLQRHLVSPVDCPRHPAEY